MKRDTLEEYYDLFKSNPIMQPNAIRGMEKLGEWGAAAKCWESIGYKDDAAACRLIESSIKSGDAFRDATKHLHEWVDETVENGIMSKEEALKTIYPKLHELYLMHEKNF